MKRQLLAVLVAAAVAGIISLFTARRIEAQYSSPVRVMNTVSAPAFTSSINQPGRTAYQTTAAGCGGASTCALNFPAVASGHRLVIQQLAVSLNYSTVP